MNLILLSCFLLDFLKFLIFFLMILNFWNLNLLYFFFDFHQEKYNVLFDF